MARHTKLRIPSAMAYPVLSPGCPPAITLVRFYQSHIEARHIGLARLDWAATTGLAQQWETTIRESGSTGRPTLRASLRFENFKLVSPKMHTAVGRVEWMPPPRDTAAAHTECIEYIFPHIMRNSLCVKPHTRRVPLSSVFSTLLSRVAWSMGYPDKYKKAFNPGARVYSQPK